jgi:ribosome-binding protein aMBF1 (putative translation factor)
MRKSVHSEAQEHFCKVLIDARKNAGLSQQELADRLKRPQSFVAKIEAGERRVDVIEFITIASALAKNPSQMIQMIMRKMK